MEPIKFYWMRSQGVEDSVLQILWENVPVVTSIILIALLSAWLSFRLARFCARFERNERVLFESISRMDRVESRLTALEVRVAQIDTKLDMLIDFIIKGKNKGPANG
jgi:hypothetical protein